MVCLQTCIFPNSSTVMIMKEEYDIKNENRRADLQIKISI
jgi:hypothetical protein